MYEESLAMPMLMQFPGVIEAGSEIDALTQNLDFAPTFLDFASAEIPEAMQGRSLRSLMNNSVSDEDFRNGIYYHYYDFPAFHMVKRHYGIRTDRFKLMHFYDDIDVWEMYDLQEDPNEMDNIYTNPKYAEVRKELHSNLDSLQQKYKVTEEEFATTPKTKVNQAYRNFARMAGENPKNYPGYKNE
ncbi:sulfatase/phosphatase domain-containing protein [Salegentibacter holothuriorum]|uniref:sulfatase/phosphatase domain-containing protein n=1 Tax=Salegentibacter holothuriorum TaxID=241145 RepID=UPI0009A5E681|nr:sulfatase/phosphatase domain-containing protein [Salegentibacter holothuriorum]